MRIEARNLRMRRIGAGLILALFGFISARAETVSVLFARGYTVMPQPQMVTLGASDFVFGGTGAPIPADVFRSIAGGAGVASYGCAEFS
jgi:hypothetical protein